MLEGACLALWQSTVPNWLVIIRWSFTSLDRLKGPWGWEIQRKSTPLGIRNYDSDFKTEAAARIAGEKAIREFLDRLCREG
jgi:hypothetical protein